MGKEKIPFLPENIMNNKTKQIPKISILSRLVYNLKKQDNSQNKIWLYFYIIRRAYNIIISLCQYITSIKLQLITKKNTKWELKRLKQVVFKKVYFFRCSYTIIIFRFKSLNVVDF